MTSGSILHHRRSGRGPGKVLLLHGWLLDGRVWDRVTDLGPPGEALVPDLRGSGGSGGLPAPGLDGHVDDLLALLDAAGWDTCAVVGHSMGGVIAQRLALRAPDRVARLGLLAPVPASGLTLDPATRGRFEALAGDRAALRGFFAEQLRAPGDAEDLAEVAAETPPGVVKLGLDAWTGAAFAAELPQLDVPTWVAGGADDPFLPEALLRREVAAPIRDARYVTLRDAGHYPQLDQPEAVARWVREVTAG